MISLPIHRWLDRVRNRFSRSSRPSTLRRHRKPQIELLEARTVPSTLTINTTSLLGATINVNDGPAGQTTVSSSDPLFNPVTFTNQTTVTINDKGGHATWNVNNPHPATGLTTLNLVESGPSGVTGSETFNVTTLGGKQLNLTATGTAATNKLVGPAAAQTWNITGTDTGNITGLVTSFTDVGNLTSGGGGDKFTFAAAGKTTGTIDGSAAGAAHTTIIGPNATEAWSITGNNSGSAGFVHAFLHVANLTGGTGADTFTFTGAASVLSGTLDGGTGTGTNTLVGPNLSEQWTITGVNAGTLADFSPVVQRATFKDIQNLTGGTAQDVFTFMPAGSVAGKINGGAGAGNWFVYSALATPVNVNLTTGAASGVTGAVSNVGNLIGSAPGGDTITGSAAGGVLVGHNSNNTITAGSGRSVIIGGFGRNFVQGGASDDIVIAGNTLYDANIAALDAIFSEWQSGASFAARVSALRQGVVDGNGVTDKLVLNQTVFCTATTSGPRFGRGGGTGQSTLLGNGGSNWFFTLYNINIVDLGSSDVVN